MTAILLFVVPGASFTNPLQLWALSATPLFQTFLILIIAVMTVILALIIFKNQYEEGTDLIAISKKITKKGMILTKFFVFGIFSLMISLSSCVLSCFAGLMPGFELKYLWPLISGILIGNLVSFLVFGGIASVACLKMNRVGVLLLNLLVAVFFFVYQIIGWLTFSTPLLSLANNNIGTATYITAQRNEEGTYEENHLVNLVPDSTVSQETMREHISSWKDIKKYWDNLNCSAKSKAYMATNLMNQLGSSYFSTGLDGFAQRQANRIFGFSSLYNYELTSPASPEIPNNEKTINWIYTGYLNADIEIKDYGIVNADIPYSFAFPGITVSNEMAVLDKTFADEVPIGTYKKSFNSKPDFVYLEPSEWQKYSEGFTKMYNTIFRYDLLDTNGINYYDLNDVKPYDYQSAWCLKNSNLNKYYDLVWACLTNNTDKYLKMPLESFDFNINSVDDLNERFIQFKYFIFNLAQQEQKQIFDRGPKEDEMASYNVAVNTLKQFTNKTGVEWVKNTWYMTSTHSGTIPFIFLDSHSKAPAFPLLSKMIQSIYGYDQPTCSYGTIMKCANIYNYCVSPNENYLFCTLNNDAVKRTNDRSGQVSVVSQRWLPAVVSSMAKYNQNWNMFFYDTKRDMPLFVYPIIWISISICLLGFSGVVFRKYDIQ